MATTATPTICPFAIVVDTREQAPYSFTGLAADAKQQRRPVIVRTIRRALATGDYSIDGLESRVTIERKSLTDAFGTFGGDRDRWERELERMASLAFAAVVIEADWPAVLAYKPPVDVGPNGRWFTPKMFYRSVLAWQQRFPMVHWWFCPTRLFAERTAFRVLQRFWEDVHDPKLITRGEGER